MLKQKKETSCHYSDNGGGVRRRDDREEARLHYCLQQRGTNIKTVLPFPPLVACS